jgi:hypothetical protein
MSSILALSAPARTTLLRPMLIGGVLAATFDLTSAFITLGWGNPRLIAGGLLGHEAAHGGAGTWILGVLLHYSIALCAAAFYCIASRWLPFLRGFWLVCGLFYGIAVFLVMYLVVLPLSAYHYTGPYTYSTLVQGLVVHMVLVGLPISYSLRRFSAADDLTSDSAAA